MSDFPNSTRLPAPLRITEQVWPEGTVPVVTIRCITYQHVNFIRDAIEGFLMQETTFPVEIIIHDDASTDGTAEIVKDYAEKHPQLFRPILQKENQYSQGREVWARVRNRINEMQRGEFIALCEGDDYWTAKEKLQKQVEVLESNLKASSCFHWVKVVDGEGQKLPEDWSHWRGDIMQPKDFFYYCLVCTCSIVFRKAALSLPAQLTKLPMGDWPQFILLSIFGEMCCIKDEMASYRRHAGGAWSGNACEADSTWGLLLMAAIKDFLPAELHGDADKALIFHSNKFVRYVDNLSEATSGYELATSCADLADKQLIHIESSAVIARYRMAIISEMNSLLLMRGNHAWTARNWKAARSYLSAISPEFLNNSLKLKIHLSRIPAIAYLIWKVRAASVVFFKNMRYN